MSNPLFDLSPYQSEVRHNYRPDWRDASVPDPAWDELDSENCTQKDGFQNRIHQDKR